MNGNKEVIIYKRPYNTYLNIVYPYARTAQQIIKKYPTGRIYHVDELPPNKYFKAWKLDEKGNIYVDEQLVDLHYPSK